MKINFLLTDDQVLKEHLEPTELKIDRRNFKQLKPQNYDFEHCY